MNHITTSAWFAVFVGCDEQPPPIADDACVGAGAVVEPEEVDTVEKTCAYTGGNAVWVEEADGSATYVLGAPSCDGYEYLGELVRVGWDGADGSQLPSLTDPERFPGLGRCLAGGGDVDQDGAADLAVTWTDEDEVGAVILDPTADDPIGRSTVQILGTDRWDRLGFTCAYAGSYLLLGARNGGVGGVVYAFDQLGPGQHGVEAASVSLVSHVPDERLAASIAPIGDTDGNGLANVVVAGYAGAYILDVEDLDAGAGLLDLPRLDQVLLETAGLGTTGDLNGDGLDDWGGVIMAEYDVSTSIHLFSGLESLASIETDPELPPEVYPFIGVGGLTGVGDEDGRALLYTYETSDPGFATIGYEVRMLQGPFCGVLQATDGSVVVGGDDVDFGGIFAYDEDKQILGMVKGFTDESVPSVVSIFSIGG